MNGGLLEVPSNYATSNAKELFYYSRNSKNPYQHLSVESQSNMSKILLLELQEMCIVAVSP